VITAVGTGGTVAGLLVGLRLAGLSTRVMGVVVNDQLRLDATTVTRLAGRGARLLRERGADLPRVAPSSADVTMPRGWLGAGYGHATRAGQAALALLADREGVALDPVYTAKAMAALLDLVRDGRLGGGPLLFLRTDGPR
jgi:D-cysteine desulfhydrase